MKYDFDIQLVAPITYFRDPKLNQLFRNDSLSAGLGGGYVAFFRDKQAAEALISASPKVQEFFRASGFGFATFDSGAPEGFYPAEYEAAHLDVLARLSENLKVYDLTGEDTNAFDFTDFLSNALSARPIDLAPHAVSASESAFRSGDERFAPKYPSLDPMRSVRRAAVALIGCAFVWLFALLLVQETGMSNQLHTNSLHAGSSGVE